MEIEAPQEFIAKMDVNRWMIFTPYSYTRSVYCGDQIVDTIRIEGQTDLTLPPGCRVSLTSHILSTDDNVNVDFKIRVYNWKYDGNVFDGFISGTDNLSAMIQELINTRSKFGLKDLSHLKHYYTYSTDQFAAIWQFLSNFSLFSWLGNFYMFLSFVPLLILLYCGFKFGLFSLMFNCCRSRGNRQSRRIERVERRENQADNLNANRPVRGEIVVPNAQAIPLMAVAPSAPLVENVNFENETYRGTDRRARLQRSPCNPGKMEGNIEDFVCDHHVERGSGGHCMGTWLKK